MVGLDHLDVVANVDVEDGNYHHVGDPVGDLDDQDRDKVMVEDVGEILDRSTRRAPAAILFQLVLVGALVGLRAPFDVHSSDSPRVNLPGWRQYQLPGPKQ